MAIGVTVLASGSNGNCIAVHADGNTVLVDCGVSLRMLRARMAETGIPEASVRAILVTHRHDDHIKGVDKAAARFGVPVFTHYEAAQKMEKVFKKPVTTTILDVGAEFPLSGFMVTSFPVEHDAETVGFVLTKESSKVGIATDMGRATQAVEFNLRDSSTLVLESNYDMDMLAMSNRTWMLKQRKTAHRQYEKPHPRTYQPRLQPIQNRDGYGKKDSDGYETTGCIPGLRTTRGVNPDGVVLIRPPTKTPLRLTGKQFPQGVLRGFLYRLDKTPPQFRTALA